MIFSVAVLASSTISDPLQKLAESGMADSLRVAGSQDFTTWRQQERLALLRRIAGDADAVRRLSGDELSLLFGEPTLRREEREAVSWHFTSGECALDVYFPKRSDGGTRHKPVYAEYRVRSQADESGIVDRPGGRLDHRACVRSLFSNARPPVSAHT